MKLRSRLWTTALVCVSAGIQRPASAVDAPHSDLNPATGRIESVDSVTNGSNRDVRHVIDHGLLADREVEFLTTTLEDDLDPRIAIKANGDTTIVWWRDADTDQVLYRAHNQAAGSWGPESIISLDGENSRHPAIAIDGSTTWVAYQLDSGGRASVGVVAISDGPEPFPQMRTVLATTALASDPAVRVRCESGHVWVVWIDDFAKVGWSEYDAASKAWSPASYELNVIDEEDVRGRIRSKVLQD